VTIALDYDGTYTADPKFWQDFIALATTYGHTVVCVTKRGPNNQGIITVPNIETVHTNRSAKAEYVKNAGLHIDIWIDDSPSNLYVSG
jgi:hypothetical protein